MSSVPAAPYHVLLNGKRFPLYELDDQISLKARIAANMGVKAIPALAGSLLSNLVILEGETEVVRETKQVAGCRAVHVVNEDGVRNPLAGQSFKLQDFFTDALDAVTRAAQNAAAQKKAARILMERYNIQGFVSASESRGDETLADSRTNYTIYCYYLLFFIFGRGLLETERKQDGLEAFGSALATINVGLTTAIEGGMRVGMRTIETSYEAEERVIGGEIKTLRNSVKRDLAFFQGYAQGLDYAETPTSEIRLDKTQLEVRFQMAADVYELFNALTLSPHVPFAAAGDFFKVLKTFKPPQEWAVLYPEPDLLVLYVLNSATESMRNRTHPEAANYSTIFVKAESVDEKTGASNVLMYVHSKVDDELREENLLERIFQVFPWKVTNCSYEQKSVWADYLIQSPTDLLDIPYFYDMVMNDPVVSQLMLIEEAAQTFRIRGGIFSYFRWNSHMDRRKYLTIRLNIGVVETRHQGRAPELNLRPGDKFLSVNIHARTLGEVERIRIIFNRVLEYYFQEYRTKVSQQYGALFPDIDTRLEAGEVRQPKAPIRTKVFLKDFLPEVFPEGYQAICNWPPTLLETEAEAEAAKAEDKDVLTFPQHGEGDPHWYVCDRKKRKFVGLRENHTLYNRSRYPYLPCCYPTDHREKTSSLRFQYENDPHFLEGKEQVMDEEKKSGRPKVFLSQMVLNRDDHGVLPPLVENFLLSLEPRAYPLTTNRFPFVRQGSLRGSNSCLDALLRAVLNYDAEIEGKTEHETSLIRKAYRNHLTARLPIIGRAFEHYEILDGPGKTAYLSEIRRALASLLPSNITAQQSYDLSSETLRAQLLDSTSYLDPRLYWRLLEEAFDLELFIFRLDEEHPQGVLGAPQFLQEYLQYRPIPSPHRFVVILFETIGGSKDVKTFPQVELVRSYLHYDRERHEVLDFSYFVSPKDSAFLVRLREAFSEMYAYGGKANLPIPKVFVSRPIAQCVDFYGKVRMLQFAGGLCLLTDPLPPLSRSDLASDLTPGCQLTPVPLEVARRFLQLEEVKQADRHRVVIAGQVVGLNCHKLVDDKRVNFYLPLVPYQTSLATATHEQDESIPLGPSFLARNSLLQSYNNQARLARYLIEYVIWVFSRWWKRTVPGQQIEDSLLVRFAASEFQEIRGHQYPSKIPRRFDQDLSGLFVGSRLIVPSLEVRNRLVYALRIRLLQNTEEIESYVQRTFIRDYYVDVTDFDLQDSNVILYGVDMVLSWIKSRLPHYVLYDQVQLPPCPADTIERIVGETGDEKEDKAREELCDRIETQGLIIEPYFLRLEGLPGIYLIQQGSSLANALYICETWTEREYNPGTENDGKVSTTMPFRLVAYNGPLETRITTVNGPPGSAKFTILVFRWNDRVWFSAMLPFPVA